MSISSVEIGTFNFWASFVTTSFVDVYSSSGIPWISIEFSKYIVRFRRSGIKFRRFEIPDLEFSCFASLVALVAPR